MHSIPVRAWFVVITNIGFMLVATQDLRVVVVFLSLLLLVEVVAVMEDRELLPQLVMTKVVVGAGSRSGLAATFAWQKSGFELRTSFVYSHEVTPKLC